MMEINVSRSLARSMCDLLHKKLLGESSWITVEIYQPGKYPSCFGTWRMRLSGWRNGRYRKSPIMTVSPNGKRNFFEVKISGTFNDSYDRQLGNLNSDALATVFNELCKLSDEGLSLIYLESELCQKKQPVEFIKPYEGSSLKIEADLLAPDFAYLDKPADICLPF